MSARAHSLAFLTSHRCTPPQAIAAAAAHGYNYVGLRLWPNMPGAPQQHLLGEPAILQETQAAMADTGVGVFDVEIIRIAADFDPHTWDPLYEACAALGARTLLVAADDTDEARLSHSYAQLCEVIRPYGLTADLEFMPWTAVKNVQDALRVIASAGNPANAGILVDALHYGRSTSTLEDIRAIPRHLLHYAQICDAQAGGHFSTEEMIHAARCERLFPGEGTIDLHGLMAALPSELPISVEIVHFDREAQMPPTEWAGLCLQKSLPYTIQAPTA